MYFNPVTRKRCFGLVRLGRSCVTITTTLRKLYLKGGITLTGQRCKLDMKTIPVSEGQIIKIIGE